MMQLHKPSTQQILVIFQCLVDEESAQRIANNIHAQLMNGKPLVLQHADVRVIGDNLVIEIRGKS
jgi:hypothetical protein